MKTSSRANESLRLEDCYTLRQGRVFMNGTQALVRIVLDQARRDRLSGLQTAGLVSGYRGSPLGGVDLELWRAEHLLKQEEIVFLPAVNEDLAATAILGSQQVEGEAHSTVQAVFGLWYGKGPGVDRAGDALKHGNAYGSSPHGGVLVVAGDDHGCVSSSMPHQSDVAFMAWFMPTLSPASVEEYLSFGAYGYALSRYSGMWTGFKTVSECVESAVSFYLPTEREFKEPNHTIPPAGLHYRWPDLPGPQIETRMEAKKEAVLAFADANPIDRQIYNLTTASYGIVTTGKAHLDLMEALRLLGLDSRRCHQLGIDIYKVGMVWPLARRGALDFVRDKREILVVEEKRGIIESQLKEYFYDHPGDKPERMVGKRDENGMRLVPWTGELSPHQLAEIVADRLDAVFGLELGRLAARYRKRAVSDLDVNGATRTPYFCSGCPHNISTKVPEGSKALAGIGCHFMASWMNRETSSLIQMGGEGVNWVASSIFTGKRHVFQNLGEGTFYHSGSMAVRQAVAARTNITYKILFNDAVAMTGGQPVDGPLSVPSLAHTVRAEGVGRIALVSDMPEKFAAGDFPSGVTIHHRDELDEVQKELRDVPGVSVLIYEQLCASEKRKRRKRNKLPDPPRFVFINERVCEGCGDCSVESNCLSVEPLETPLGRKRKINLSSCNKDYSCLNGFCPSFVTVTGNRRQGGNSETHAVLERASLLPEPIASRLHQPFNLLITGVGGTGVLTIGQIVAMAAHLENKGVSVLDFTGFAQKFGPVLGHVRLAESPDELHQVRIDEGSADAVLGCDLVVSSSQMASRHYHPGTRMAVNTAEMPTGDLVLDRDGELGTAERLAALENAMAMNGIVTFDANRNSEFVFGDGVFANMMMLGFGWQHGLVPLSLTSIMQAIELNGVAIEKNCQALAWGRLAAGDPQVVAGPLSPLSPQPETLDETIAWHKAFLAEYQDARWAKRYASLVERVRAAEKPYCRDVLSRSVAASWFKLMSYKDEYEVARLYSDGVFRQRLASQFEDGFSVEYHLAPPLLSRRRDARGRPGKRRFGPWMRGVFPLLAAAKVLRGSWLDVFGYSRERRMERELIDWYENRIEEMLACVNADLLDDYADAAACTLEIRGFGPVKEKAVFAAKNKMEERLATIGVSR